MADLLCTGTKRVVDWSSTVKDERVAGSGGDGGTGTT